MRRLTVLMGTLVAVGLLATACGGGSGTQSGPDPNAVEHNPPGDIPDNQVFVPFRSSTGAFKVDVPEGWARTSSGGVVTFTDKLNSVTVTTQHSPSAPTVQTATSRELPGIVASVGNYAPGHVTTVQRSGEAAILITYEADGPKDPVTGKVVRDAVERYEFFKDGTEAIITLSGPVGADNVDPWKTITESFAWTS